MVHYGPDKTICQDDFDRIKNAATILGEPIWLTPTGGIEVDGTDYRPTFAIHSRQEVIDAMKVYIDFYEIKPEELT